MDLVVCFIFWNSFDILTTMRKFFLLKFASHVVLILLIIHDYHTKKSHIADFIFATFTNLYWKIQWRDITPKIETLQNSKSSFYYIRFMFWWPIYIIIWSNNGKSRINKTKSYYIWWVQNLGYPSRWAWYPGIDDIGYLRTLRYIWNIVFALIDISV